MPRLPAGVDLIHYVGSGNYLVANESGLLLRFDADSLYFWDAKRKREIPFARDTFNELVAGEPSDVRHRRARG